VLSIEYYGIGDPYYGEASLVPLQQCEFSKDPLCVSRYQRCLIVQVHTCEAAAQLHVLSRGRGLSASPRSARFIEGRNRQAHRAAAAGQIRQLHRPGAV